MRINYPQLKRLWHRIQAGSAQEFRSLAVSERILCPEETVTTPPALYPDGSLERITELSPWRGWDEERAHWQGREVTHHAAIAYDVDNVDLVGAYLYAGAAKQQIAMGEQKLWIQPPAEQEQLSNANLVSSLYGSQFFGTLLVDDFPLNLIADRDPNNISVAEAQSDHERGYREIFDLPRAPGKRCAHIHHLTLYQDFAQNSSKEARYRTLRARMASKYSSEQAPTGVYIRRGRNMGEPRSLENETEVEQLLTSHGFVVIDPATMSADEITRKSIGARIIAGIEGSQLSHGIFSAADNASFLVFQPPWRFSMSYKEFANCLDMRFAFVVGDTSENGFTLRLGEIEESVKLLD